MDLLRIVSTIFPEALRHAELVAKGHVQCQDQDLRSPECCLTGEKLGTIHAPRTV